jgi:dTDP-4-dehydrorhamnose reductase
MKSILITGGAGLLAINWALAVRERYKVVLGIHLRHIEISGADTRYLDLDSKDRLLTQLDQIQPDLVVHTAGMTSVDECERRPAIARYANVTIAENVAQACSHLQYPLVHISTDHLFTGDMKMVDEMHPPKPRNVYGRTKAEAECRVLDSHSDALVIRTNFFGWGPSYRRSFSDAIVNGLRARKMLNLYRDVYFTPILIKTAVDVVHELLDKKAGGIFNVVGSDRISKFEFGVRIAQVFELDSRLIIPTLLRDTESYVDRPLDMSLSNLKAKILLGKEIGGTDIQIPQLRQQELDGNTLEILKL